MQFCKYLCKNNFTALIPYLVTELKNLLSHMGEKESKESQNFFGHI